jgi:hypothetical protein
MVAWLHGDVINNNQTQIPATIRAIDIVAMNGNTVVLQSNGQVAVFGMKYGGANQYP